jgi:hypothetical protein
MTQKQYTVYLAGPMSNIAGFNFPLFFDATDWLRNVLGWKVWSPAEKDLDTIPWDEMQTVPGFDTGDLKTYCENSSFTMSNAMEWDLPAIMNSDGIVLLPGWETSTGCRWERTCAEALGRKVWLLTPNTVVGDAWEINEDTCQDRLTQFLRAYPTELEAVRNA